MAKVPTIYDIGNFSIDWNNAEVLTGSDRPINICRQANKDGVVFVYAHKDESSAGCTLYVFKENQTNISDALVNVSNGNLPCIGCGGTFPIGGTELSIIVKKDEWWCIVTNSNPQIKCVYFVPFTYPAVQAQPGCVSYVIETGHNLDNTAFYRKYSDGYIEQYGKILLDQAGTAAVTVTLPTQFTSSNYIVTLGMTGRNNGGATPMQECNVNDLTESTFELRYYLTGVASGSSHYIFYRACGY